MYADVADVPAYHALGLTYPDICTPNWLRSNPALFLGFWGRCFNDYRDATPHEGYALISGWRNAEFTHTDAAEAVRSRAGGGHAFFCFTSNVDAHWARYCAPSELRECHGNAETWQCANTACSSGGRERHAFAVDAQTLKIVRVEEPTGPDAEERRWLAPAGYRFHVDEDSRLAADGDPAVAASSPRPMRAAGEPMADGEPPHDDTMAADAFASNHPRCVRCGGPARPSILMFGDGGWEDDGAQASHWERWREAVVQAAADDASLRVVVLEAGAGGNVPTVRHVSEDMVERVVDVGATATLIRVNPDLPLADDRKNAMHTIPLRTTGLAAVRAIDERLSRIRASSACSLADAEVPLIASLLVPPEDRTDEDSDARVCAVSAPPPQQLRPGPDADESS